MLYKLLRILGSSEGQGDIPYFPFVYRDGINFIKVCISIAIIKIINAQIVGRTFILDDVVFTKDSSDIFSNLIVVILFQYNDIDLLRFRP